MTEEKKQEEINKKSLIMATGRRKESVARIFLYKGTGKFTVNKRTLENYFPRESHRISINHPINTAKLDNKLDINATVRGGGVSGQAEAVKHGISRAIIKFDEAMRTTLKKAGFLTRDSRAKERKKYGRKRARKRFQYSKL